MFVYTEDVAIYYYGASTSNEKFRNLMAPYLLQWNAILI
ncbi:MAG: peptidoglycan bridge formation glycyltransferase FemA/FemB family protein [Candidatus Peribacteria bacterium]|nr:peptidoglycan bridge formation glycyltransferase FemA/FemB family protein [Candidatus Peribacteria bacterium]